MRRPFGLFIAVFLSIVCFGQDFDADFQTYFAANDSAQVLKTLLAWEKANPEDPELYTSYFNYYFNKSRNEMLVLTTEQPEGEGFELKDSANHTAGYIGSQTNYDQSDFQKGIEKINKGIELFPDRLDMRFGKIYALGQRKEWDAFTAEIIRTVEYSHVNHNRWTWTHNEKQKNGEDFFLSSLQDYQLQLYDTGDDSLLMDMQEIAIEVLKYYPDHIESLSNLAVTYLIQGEYDKAIEPLLKAEKLDPRDCIVLANIAQAYKLKGDKKRSTEYYEKVIQYGDEESKEFAGKQIRELNKQ